MDEVADGVYFVALARLREPDLVPGAIAAVLGLPDADDLDERLRERELLLVLDNLEQLRRRGRRDRRPARGGAATARSWPRAGWRCASPASASCASSRWRSTPPSPCSSSGRAAVRAGLRRRRSIGDGVRAAGPATARARARRARACGPCRPPSSQTASTRRLPVLVGGRRDADERQRTLRATIAWSYDLLGAPERAAFARISVFAGGCDHDAANTVCDVDPPTLHALADDSLLVATPDGRFRMLELVRELAEEELAASGDEEMLRRRHAEHFLALAHEARSFARGPEEKVWLDRLTLELDNLRAALRWSLEAGPRAGPDARRGARAALGTRTATPRGAAVARAAPGRRRTTRRPRCSPALWRSPVA